MRAAFVLRPGPAESIQLGELPDPTPGPGQVLVRVHASAVNPIDTYIRGGLVAMNLPSPFVPGCDLAGEVEALGPGASRFAPGDPVWGSNQGLLGRQGTLAELAAVDENLLYPLPAGVDPLHAAAGALVGITAHLGLVREAALAPGETLLVQGGSGGVGSAVVQLGRALGARVLATGGSAEKLARCRDHGADPALNYRADDFADQVRAAAPGGVNVWWETRRDPDFDLAVGLLAERGRMVVMAGRDSRPQFPVGPFYVKGCRLLGFVMFKATPEEQQRAAEDINRWLSEGLYRPPVDRVFTLDQAAEAHKLQESATLTGAGGLAGKIVVRVSS